MNLHVAPDNVFTNKFIANLDELGILSNNRVVVRTNDARLKHIQADVPFAGLYKRQYKNLVGSTAQYDRVYIHQFTPLLYRWIALNDFNEINWAVWGADLYNLPFNQHLLYGPLTFSRYVNKAFSYHDLLYHIKVALLHNPYRNAAYSKVRNVLTWMGTEYEFAHKTLTALRANHQFFFYENQLPYEHLDKVVHTRQRSDNSRLPELILGNSSTPDLNHLDAVAWMQDHGVQANLRIPVSYGDRSYTAFLRKSLSFYRGGSIEFVDRYMTIEEYLEFLNRSDGLIMNNIRPQGYGNIFMMMYLGKPVFLNSQNLSAPELDRRNLRWKPLEELPDFKPGELVENKGAVMELLSHEKLLNVYRDLFA